MGLECCRDTAKIIVQNLANNINLVESIKLFPKAKITKKISEVGPVNRCMNENNFCWLGWTAKFSFAHMDVKTFYLFFTQIFLIRAY